MLWLKLLGGGMAFVFANFLFLRYKSWLPYFLVFNLVYFYFNGRLVFRVGPINIYLWDIFFLFCMISLFYRIFIEKFQFDATAKKVIFFLLLYLGWLEISEIYNFIFNPERHAFDDLIRSSISNLYPLALLIIYTNFDSEGFRKFFRVVAYCALFLAVVTLVKEIFDIGGGFKTSSGTVRRMRGEVVMFIQIGLIYFLITPYKNQIIRYGFIFTCVAAVGLIGHRSGFLSVAAVFVFYIWMLYKAGRLGYAITIATPLIAFGGVAFLAIVLWGNATAVTSFLVRASDTFDTENRTSEGRLHKWTWALRSTAENPLGGTKLNLLPDYYGRYTLEADYGFRDIANAHQNFLLKGGTIDPWPPHNMFINIVSKNGIVGLILFLLLVITVIKNTCREGTPEELFIKGAAMAEAFVYLFFNNQHTYDSASLLYLAILVIPLLYKSEQKAGIAANPLPLRPAGINH